MVSGTPFQSITQAMDKYGQSYVVPGPSGTPGSFPVSGTVNVVATPGAASFLKAEDSPAVTADALVGVAGRINTNDSVLAADGDYTTIALGQFGQTLSTLVYDGNLPAGRSALEKEDLAMTTDGLAGARIFAQTQDPLSVDQGSSGDAAYFKVDRAGRTITTLAPAGESWQSCGTATASTADVAIKASVASNRIYTTAITCKNTSATVASSLDFKDGTTIIAVGGISQMAAGAAGSFSTTFPVPLRGTSATALNFATNISVSSVTCCASGYISVN